MSEVEADSITLAEEAAAAAPTPMLVVPIRDRVIVEQEKADHEKLHKGLLHIPESARERPYQGKVVAVGDGRIMPNGANIPLVVQVGDTVLFGKFSGTEIKVNGVAYMMLREDEIIATMRPVGADGASDKNSLLVYKVEEPAKEESKEGLIGGPVSPIAEAEGEFPSALQEDVVEKFDDIFDDDGPDEMDEDEQENAPALRSTQLIGADGKLKGSE